MALPVTPLKARNNTAILDAIRADASMDYHKRIPSADKAGVRATMEALTDPLNRRLYNEFFDTLINRIGLVIARNNSWTNPLAPFKRGMLEYGSHIQEIQTGLLKAHTYDPDREQMEGVLFGTERPDVQTNFHTINRQDYYKITINDDLIRRAFLENEGMATFVSQLMEAPSTSDQWDEFLLTCSLFAEYERSGGFHHIHVPNVKNLTSDSSDAKAVLRTMRAMSKNMQFLSTKYNAAKMPISANPEDLMILCTPEFEAAIDVEALAGAFNVDRMNMYGRVVTIPEEHFGVEGCQAIMTTKDFFVIADSVFQTTTQPNPAALHNNYFLHHHQVVSASRFVPAVMLTTGASDDVITLSAKPTSAEISALDTTGASVDDVKRGDNVGFTATVKGAQGEMENAGTVWSVSGQLDSRTFITQNGVLHVSGEESATSLTVKGETTWVNPDNAREDSLTASKTVTVSGDVLSVWPVTGGVVTNVTVAGERVTLGNTNTVRLPEGTTVKPSDVVVETSKSADVDVKVEKVGTGYTVTLTTDSDTQGSVPAVTVIDVSVG